MKYDKNTMNSLQEAYKSVSEELNKDSKNAINKSIDIGKKYMGEYGDKSPNEVNKKLRDTANALVKARASTPEEQQDATKRLLTKAAAKRKKIKTRIGEAIEPDGMKYSDAKKIKRQKQLLDASKNAPTYKNKIVPTKTRTEEAIKMTKKEYANTHKDFKSDDKNNPRVTRYVQGKGTVSTPVKLTDEVDKKKEMDDKMKEVEDMRSLPTRMNLIKTKLRAMGLNMSHQLKGKELSEVIDYALDEATRYKKEMGYDVGGTKKPTSPKTPDPALDVVKAKYKGQIMRSGSNQPKKVKGAKSTVGTNKYKDMADKKKETAADAKKRGFDNVQSYVDTMARYGGKKNYDQGKGLGS